MRLACKGSAYRFQKGQSMAEFLATIALFIVPFFFGMNYLAKVGESSNKTHNAARYGAWERTVFHPDGTSNYQTKESSIIAIEANNRIFSHAKQVLDTNKDVTLKNTEDMELDSMSYLGEKNHKGLPIYVDQQAQDQNQNQNQNNPIAITRYSLTRSDHPDLSAVSRVFTRVSEGVFGLNMNNFHTASVVTPLIKSEYLRPSDQNGATAYDKEVMSARSVNAIYTGSWNAYSPSYARDTVERGLPSANLSILNQVFNFLGNVGLEDFDSHRGEDALNLGKIDVDRVPCQRVAGNVGSNNC